MRQARGQARLKRVGGPKRNDKSRRPSIPAARQKNLAVHFSSKTTIWETPKELFEKLDHEFGFTLDVCALPENAKCERYFTPREDGLKQDWKGVCWMNPPYGSEIREWVQKAYRASLYGTTVVCLLPARTDTTWWHEFVLEANEIRFLRGRLRFVGAKSSAPFPSVVVVFRPWFSPTYLKSAA